MAVREDAGEVRVFLYVDGQGKMGTETYYPAGGTSRQALSVAGALSLARGQRVTLVSGEAGAIFDSGDQCTFSGHLISGL